VRILFFVRLMVESIDPTLRELLCRLNRMSLPPVLHLLSSRLEPIEVDSGQRSEIRRFVRDLPAFHEGGKRCGRYTFERERLILSSTSSSSGSAILLLQRNQRRVAVETDFSSADVANPASTEYDVETGVAVVDDSDVPRDPATASLRSVLDFFLHRRSEFVGCDRFEEFRFGLSEGCVEFRSLRKLR